MVPQSGSVEIDGVPLDDTNRGAWHSAIAYVPQNVFLCDATLAENIALGTHLLRASIVSGWARSFGRLDLRNMWRLCHWAMKRNWANAARG